MRGGLGKIFALVVILVLSGWAYAGEGDLDLTFGTVGKVTTDFLGSADDVGNAIAVRPDGKILVAGSTDNAVSSDFLLVRYNSNGSIDTSFGTNGFVITDFGGSNDFAKAIAIQPDTKIVVAGRSNDDFALARYNSDGTLDPTFGSGGLVTTDFDNDVDRVEEVLIQSDGKIVAAGTANVFGADRYALARYDTNGILDPGFGTGGLVSTNLSGGDDRGEGAALQTDGKIVVVGESQDDFAVVRYTTAGIPDTTFNGTGIVFTDFAGSFDMANAVAIQADGKIVAAGITDAGGGGNNFAFVRYNTDGTLDTTFDVNGKLLTDFAIGDDEALGVAIQSDGKIVAAGTATINGRKNFALTRYSSTGVLDGTFDVDGKVAVDLGSPAEGHAMALRSGGKIVTAGITTGNLVTGDDVALLGLNSNGGTDGTFGTNGVVVTDVLGHDNDVIRGAALQTDGKIVVVGSTTFAGNRDFALARYNSDGTLDTTFGTLGVVHTDFSSRNDNARAVVIQPDGKIVVAGFSGITGVDDFALARYNPNGTLDTSFGTSGLVRTDFGKGDDQAFGVALQTDGKIVAAGFATLGTDEDFAAARYNSDGTLDLTFGSGGVVTTDFAGNTDHAQSVVIQTDGAIVLGGFSNSNNGDDDFALVRYLSNGIPDTNFSGDGKVTTDINGNDDQVFSLVIQSDDKIVAAGFTDNGPRDFALARYNTNGTLDGSFNGGTVETDFNGGRDEAHAVTLQSDGKIVAGGFASGGGGGRDFALARYDTTGNLDPNFGTGGLVTTDFEGDDDQGHAMVIQPDAKIVLAGESISAIGNPDFAVARYIGICPVITLSPLTLPDGNVGFAYNQTITATGSTPPYTFTFTGSLPPGLTLSTSGILTGTPTSSGTFNFTVTATDLNTCAGSLDYALFISPCPPFTVSPPAMPNGNLGNAYSQTVTVTGGTPPYTFAVSFGSLPPGLNLDTNTGVISGTPNTLGTFPFVITATDNAACVVNQGYTIVVVDCLFGDDFGDGVLDPNWTYIKPAWAETGGNLVATPVRKAVAVATPVFAGCQNCSVDTEMQTAGGIGNVVWLLGWYVNKGNTMELLMKEETNKWILKQRVGGRVVSKVKAIKNIDPSVVYTVRLVFDGTKFDLFVDDFVTPLATLVPIGAVPIGTEGFQAKNTTGTFGSICVK